MLTLLDLSPELLERVLLSLDNVADLGRVSQTCSAFNDLINHSGDHLWRTAYQKRYDKQAVNAAGLQSPVDWRGTVTKRDKACRLLMQAATDTEHVLDEEHVEALDLMLDSLLDAPAGIDESEYPTTSRNLTWLFSLLEKKHASRLHHSDDRLFVTADCGSRMELGVFGGSRAAERLSTYLGVANLHRRDATALARAGARAWVYDLSNWQEDRLWGPLLPDGRICWSRMEACMLVSCSNAYDLAKASGLVEETRFPCRLADARPYSAPDAHLDLVDHDWAGVTGWWRRCISFLDWNDLQRYQGAVQQGVGPRYFTTWTGPSGFTGEAVRVLSLELRVTAIKPGVFPHRPDIHFEGVNETGAFAPHVSRVHGKVWMNEQGTILWQMTSRYAGADRWYSLGAQVGGERSAFGILGSWSGVDHDFGGGDPAGPYWCWKVHEDEPDPFSGGEAVALPPPQPAALLGMTVTNMHDNESDDESFRADEDDSGSDDSDEEQQMEASEQGESEPVDEGVLMEASEEGEASV